MRPQRRDINTQNLGGRQGRSTDKSILQGGAGSENKRLNDVIKIAKFDDLATLFVAEHTYRGLIYLVIIVIN